MTQLQKRAMTHLKEILSKGENEVFALSCEKDDAAIIADIRNCTKLGTKSHNILTAFRESQQWIEDILNEKHT